MATSLLVLGGSGFVGPALCEAGLARGWEVTTFNRGRRPADPRVRHVVGDRLDPDTFATLTNRDWDIVADTWSGAPRAARDLAMPLAPRAARYVYISSRSVYAEPPPIGGRETDSVVDASSDAETGDYAELKRGSELAVQQAFGDRALLLRPGLILGPHEDVGRLPWWLERMARGGDVLAPGPPDLPLQYIDARDLARFALDAAVAGVSGTLDTVSRRGHTTTAELLDECLRLAGAPGTQLSWVPPEPILAAGIEPWMDLPIWIPAGHEYAGLHGADGKRARAAGLRCRPAAETVADTWAWLRSLDGPRPLRADLPAVGLSAEREAALLTTYRAKTSRPV